MAATLDFWDIQRPSTGTDYPHDVDFCLTENAYWDLELYGEIWDSYYNPEVILFNQKYSINNGQPLILTNWKHPRWLPGSDGVIPERFIASTYKIIIYSNANRQSVISIITGNININDPKLIDKTAWFISKIVDVTPYTNVGINQSVNIYCKILQPPNCHLKVTLRKNQDQPVTIFDHFVTDEVRYKQIDIPYTPNSNGLYTVRYTLTTNSNSYMYNWCKTTQDYIGQTESIIEVGES